MQEIAAAARHLCADAGRPFAGVRPYRRGSAFLKDASPSSGQVGHR
jgi:hypothetical protein